MTLKERWHRFKNWWTIDHVVDLCVDAILLLWEVISSPVLIAVRIIRHFIGDWFANGIKSLLKAIAHWFARKREYRKAHGHGIFRTYWWLIIPSPFILIILLILIAFIAGFAEGLPEMLELLIRGCQPGDEYWCNIS